MIAVTRYSLRWTWMGRYMGTENRRYSFFIPRLGLVDFCFVAGSTTLPSTIFTKGCVLKDVPKHALSQIIN